MFWLFIISSSISFIDMRPQNMAATVRYRPWRRSQAAIMFFESNICWVSSGTERARNCWDPLATRERGEPWHEEVETGEGDHVHGQLAEVCVELTREPDVGSGKLCLNFCPLNLSPILFYLENCIILLSCL